MAARFPIQAILGLLLGNWAGQANKAGKQLKKGLDVKGIRRSLGSVIKKGFGVATLGAGAGLASVIDDVQAFEKTLEDLAVQAGFTESETERWRASIERSSRATGLSRTQVAAAAAAVINLEGAAGLTTQKMDLLARASIASGASMDDLAKLVFVINKSMFDGAGSAADLEKALSAILQAGKEGAIPLSEMSQVLQDVGASFARVSEDGVTGAASLAAALQVTRQGFGGANQAGTGLKNLITDLGRNAKRFRKLSGGKVRIFETTNNEAGETVRRMRDVRDIIEMIANSKLAKDDKLLTDAFGSQEAMLFAQELLKNRDRWDELTEAAARSDATQEDFAKKSNSRNGKIRKSLNEMRLALEQTFTPERIETFAQAIARLADGLEVLIQAAERVGVVLGSSVDVADKLAQKKVGEATQTQFEAPQLLIDQLAALGGTGKALPQQRRGIMQRMVNAGIPSEFITGAAVEQRIQETARSQTAEMARRAGLITPEGEVNRGRVQELGRGLLRAEVATTGPSGTAELSKQLQLAARGLEIATRNLDAAAAKQTRAADALQKTQRQMNANGSDRGRR